MNEMYQQKILDLQTNRQNSLVPEAVIDISRYSPDEDVTSVPRESGVLSQEEIFWTEQCDATALLDLLVTRKIKAVDLLYAFRKRATLAQQLTNCLTELLDDAVAKAQVCDEYLEKTGEPLGPLHGLPVSFKDQIGITGRKNNVAFVHWMDRVSESTADIITWFAEQGAIPFARTSQPQTLMHLETSNNIFGVTTNPRNRTLTSGGSTGGEAALMAICGTPFGIGGDIGGSIRCPAAINGIYGFKPSVGRISRIGASGTVPGCDSIQGTLGPFGRSFRDIELFCKLYSASCRWNRDSSLFPSSFHPSPVNKRRKIRVGILRDDGVVSPLPPVRRVFDLVEAKLALSDEIEVVPFLPYQHDEAWKVITANYFEDGGATIRGICAASGEPLRPLTEWILSECEQNEKTLSSTLQGRKHARDVFRQAYSDHWNYSSVDVVIAPVTPSVAPPLGTTRYWGYTAIWNLLDYPAIAFPASEMVKGWEIDLQNETYTPRNSMEADILANYDPKTASKMPVGLQVVGKRLQEGKLLEDMAIVESVLRKP